VNDYILDPIIFLEGCPLDHGRHILKPKHNLGSFGSLLIELQHCFSDEVDLKLFVVFRRVSQSAMVTVDGMV
jgi:hypothetical protein